MHHHEQKVARFRRRRDVDAQDVAHPLGHIKAPGRQIALPYHVAGAFDGTLIALLRYAQRFFGRTATRFGAAPFVHVVKRAHADRRAVLIVVNLRPNLDPARFAGLRGEATELVEHAHFTAHQFVERDHSARALLRHQVVEKSVADGIGDKPACQALPRRVEHRDHTVAVELPDHFTRILEDATVFLLAFAQRPRGLFLGRDVTFDGDEALKPSQVVEYRCAFDGHPIARAALAVIDDFDRERLAGGDRRAHLRPRFDIGVGPVQNTARRPSFDLGA